MSRREDLKALVLSQSLVSEGLQSRLDWVFFALAAGAAAWLGWLVANVAAQAGWAQIVMWLLFWAVLAYLLLPRLHRILTNLYVPNYFIGRSRTSDGLLGDPVNLALRGTEAQVHAAMIESGWTRADPVTWRSSWRIVSSTVLRRSYLEAPVSPLFLFGRKQDFAYQQEIDGSPGKRHHVRFWKCPENWMLPGGTRVDWIAAGSYDRRVGFSAFTLQITHKIDANIDLERDHIVQSVRAANPEVTEELLRDFSTGYHSRNGGGDSIETDGDLPILDVSPLPADGLDEVIAVTHANLRPSSVAFGAVLLWVSAVTDVISAIGIVLGVDAFVRSPEIQAIDPSGEVTRVVVWVIVMLFVAISVVKALLGWLVFLGSSWARTLVLSFTVLTLFSELLLWQSGSFDPLASGSLFGIGADILILLALSSESSAAYVRRTRERARARKLSREHARS